MRARTDREAYGTFYDRHHAAILRYFLFHTESPHHAAELTAETFAQALAFLDGFDPSRGSGGAWLYGIATNQYHRFLRRGEVDRRHRRRLRMVTPVATLDDVEQTVDRLDADLLHPQLASALAELSPLLRTAVILRIGADLPYAEVAERLGCTESAARVRVRRGLGQLVTRMVGR